jgi:transcriptional regulator with PAS, ATPase and Fis domain
MDKQRTKLKKIKEEWLKLINGQTVDTSVVSPLIYESWKRSMAYGVDPYTPLKKLIPPDEVIANLTSCEDLLSEYGEIIKVICEIATETGLICRITDRNLKALKVIASADVLKQNFQKGNFFSADASENVLGTNALCLSIKENKPVQVLGPEHFNYYFHEINCSAAPIHNEKGEVIGAINVSTNSFEKTDMQTMGLVISLAKVLDNHLYINKMLEDLTVHNATLHKIMECLPSGIIYFDEKKQVKNYNKKILELLRIDGDSGDDAVRKKILRYIVNLGCLEGNKEISNEEFLLKVEGKIESFLVSNKKIFSGKEQKGNIVLVENTDNVLKLHGSLRGNSAVYTFDNIIGDNPNLQLAKQLAQKVAKSSSAVIIYGESGTGKELFAQAIHNASARKNKPFVGINCGAIPSELIESELFGYEAGAFTGALKGGKPGKLEIASGGTLFLDEIESMPLNLQIKLLRTLSIDRITRVGGTREIPIDIRLISATKKDLLKEVEKGNFREDFYYRINIFTLELPPLRERKNDIRTLADYFINSFSPLTNVQVDKIFYEALTLYKWRGNIRELRNVIERAILLLGNEKKLTLQHLPEYIQDAYLCAKLGNKIETQRTLYKENKEKGLMKIAEELAIEIALREEKGNLSKAARKLGIVRSTLYQKIKENKRLESVLKSNK